MLIAHVIALNCVFVIGAIQIKSRNFRNGSKWAQFLHAEHQIQWEKKSPHTLSDPKLRGEHAGAIHIALKCVLKCRYWCWIPRLEAFERVWWVYLKCKVFISVRATTVACLALALGPTAEVWVNRTLRVTILPPLGIIFTGVTSRTIMTSQLS